MRPRALAEHPADSRSPASSTSSTRARPGTCVSAPSTSPHAVTPPSPAATLARDGGTELGVRHRPDHRPRAPRPAATFRRMLGGLAPRGEVEETRSRRRAARRHPPAAGRRPGPGGAAVDVDRRRGLLCYNGEIFNYRELRAQLPRVGQAFRTEQRHRGAARGVPAVGRGGGDPAAAVSTPSRSSSGPPAAPTWPATRSGSSRCTGPARPGCLHVASEVKALVGARRPDRRGAARAPRLGRAGRGAASCTRTSTCSASARACRSSTTRTRPPSWSGPRCSDAIRMRVDTDLTVGVVLSGGLDSSLTLLTCARSTRTASR